MKKRRILIILSIVLILAMGQSVPADYYSDLLPLVRTDSPDFKGKTVILHTNDVHGAIERYACLPVLREEMLRRGASDVLLVDAGDFSQGEIYVADSKGKAAVDMMNAVEYDVAALGNHEFDYGYDQLMDNLSDARFQIICANIFLNRTGKLVFPPSTVIETSSGMKLGFVGITTPETVTKGNPAMTAGINFSSYGKFYDDVQSAVDDIRGKCDLVIGLTHLGVSRESAGNGTRSVDLLNMVEGIDFVIDGHSHTVMTSAKYGMPVQSTGTKLVYVGVLVIDNASRAVEDHFLLSTNGLGKDEEVAAAASGIITSVDEAYSKTFAVSEVLLNGERDPGNRTEETNLGDLITDALVWSISKDGGFEGADPDQVISVINGGNIRASINAGDVSMEDILNVLPFGDTVVAVTVKGSELLEALEASTFCTPEAIGGFPQTSGIEWTLDLSQYFDAGRVYELDGRDTTYFAPASIRRVSISSINGRPFDPEADYVVVTSNFVASGGDTYNVFSPSSSSGKRFDTGITMEDVVSDYILEELDGKITEERYGAPRGSMTVIASGNGSGAGEDAGETEADETEGDTASGDTAEETDEEILDPAA